MGKRKETRGTEGWEEKGIEEKDRGKEEWEQQGEE